MARTGIITMSMREIDRLKVIQAVVDGNFKLKLAAGRSRLTVCQVRRLVTRYREEGPSGLVAQSCTYPSNNHKATDNTKNQIKTRVASLCKTSV